MTKARITKKLVAMATTLMMLVVMAMPAIAAPLNPEGSITVHKLGGNVPGVIANETGEQVTPPAGYYPLPGADFTLWEMAAASVALVNGAVTDDNKITHHVVNDTTPPTVTFHYHNSDTGVNTTVVADMVATPYATGTTDAAGQIVFGNNDIPDGFYVLQETDAPAGYDMAAPSLIRLPLTYGPTAPPALQGKHNYDIHVYPKNVSNTDLILKNLGSEQPPVTVGSVVSFELKAKFKNDAAAPNTVNSPADLRATAAPTANPADYGVARIVESFNANFTLNGTISVYWLDSAGDIDTGSPLLASEYTLTSAAPTYTVDLTMAGIDAAIAGNKVGFGLALDANYVGAPAGVTGTPTTLSNSMTALMNPPSGDGGGGGGSTVNVPSISIQINKTDQETDLPLGGVTFALARIPAPTINYHPSVTYNPGDLATIATEYYVVGGTPITAVTDAAGNASFSHLPGYADASGATFYLKEIETVPGYQLKVNTIQVTFDTKAGYITTAGTDPVVAGWFNPARTEWISAAQVIEEADISNAPLGTTDGDEPGFSLPLTGGAGTLLFTAIGMVVMLGAVVAYLQGKKRNIQE